MNEDLERYFRQIDNRVEKYKDRDYVRCPVCSGWARKKDIEKALAKAGRETCTEQ